MLTLDHLRRALKKATDCNSPGSPDLLSAQSLHRQRSSEWVKCLAHELTTLVGDEPNVRVLYRDNKDNRDDFGPSELLYDVCICRTAEHPSARGGRALRYVTGALWLVESEFARDSAQAVKDFNKLVIGRAENKLFIGPRLGAADDEAAYLAALLPVARAAAAADGATRVYAALVPHPGEWATPDVADVTLRRHAREGWETL